MRRGPAAIAADAALGRRRLHTDAEDRIRAALTRSRHVVIRNIRTQDTRSTLIGSSAARSRSRCGAS
ncbi:hypothetical protein OG535_05635 [Kitasatospora sp. NBC_00085]|uniref:hypothetical protein n=1 Tax=unclassified Kitasatospora TaxID=2633591 RepID=UPI003251DDD6